MSSALEIVRHSARALFGAVSSFALWTFWLVLVGLLFVQLYIVSASELEIPEFILRQAEAKLAESGVRATFRRTSFDPTGRVLLDDVKFLLPGFAEPVVSARAVYVQLNPLALIVGKFDPSEIRLMDAVAAIPAALSKSGQPEEIIRGLDATVEPVRGALVVRQLSANVAGVTVSAAGTIPFPRGQPPPQGSMLADFLRNRFPTVCRQASAATGYVRQLDAPTLQLEFAPSESGALSVRVTALARAVRLPPPRPIVAQNVQATTRLLLFGERLPSDFELSADDVQVEPGVHVRRLHARVRGQFRRESLQFDLRDVTATADAVSAAGVTTSSVSAIGFPQLLPRLQATVVTRLFDEPLAIRVDTDLGDESATARFAGEISPRVLEVISQRVGVDVRKYYSFEALTIDAAEARFAPQWQFERLTARVRIPRMDSYGVTMEDGHATVELDPQRFYSPDAYARVGANFARGSYEHIFRTHQYRFLLEGRLRPMEISPWFHEWWPNFFKQLEFVDAPPAASVEVAGFWRDSRQTTVFVFADAAKTVVRGTPFDRVRTRLFIRPAFYDALEVLAARDAATAHGRFTLTAHPATHDWQSLELGLESSLDLKIAAQLMGEQGAKVLAPFKLSAPPELQVRGHFAGPAAAQGAKDHLTITAHTKGEFRFHDFPLHDASFVATLDGDDVVLDDIEATFAGGAATGHARVWGRDAERRLGFDVALSDATLGQVASRLQDFFAAQKGTSAPPPGKFVQEKANVRLDFAASAEGRYNDPLSFRGDGSAALRGAEIGEVPLLGTLSELLKFTALRFTEARTNFKIESSKLVFKQFELRGANSAIDAHGEYALDKRTLDFNAKIYPFHESESLIKSVVGAVLTPLSNAFEVKLTGSLEKPQWAFAKGPTNLLRTLENEHPDKHPAPHATPVTATTTVTSAPEKP